MAYAQFPRGSEWRKWDLHVHTPCSGLNNGFPKLADGKPDWPKYLEQLEKLTDVAVIGATDYFLIEGYKELAAFKKAGKLRNIQRIFPNIEFRLDHIVGDKRVNFHVLFSDDVSIAHIEEQFLECIDIHISGGPDGAQDKRKLKRSGLQQLGAKYKAEHANFAAKSDFEVGCMTAVVDMGQIMELLSTNDNFKDKYLTGVAEENLKLMNWDGQYHGLRKRILQNSHLMFSANPATIEWCLGRKHATPADFASEFKSLKPCVFGSDAHNLSEIGVGPGDKYTWIKADPTFDGLRQILYEPQNRIIVASTYPDAKDGAKVIKSISISGAGEWMADQTIELNRDLVAVIGGKGSGKTALADLLAFAGGEFDGANKNSFLSKAADHMAGVKVSLEWELGGKEGPFSIPHGAPQTPKVRYLSQSFVESLCSHDQHEKLVKQIEDILFQYVPSTHTLGASDFAALKDTKTRAVQLEISKIRDTILGLNAEIAALEDEIAKKPAYGEELKRLTKEKGDLEGQKPEIKSAEELRDQQELQGLREKKAGHNKDIEGKRIIVEELTAFRTRARLIKSDIERFNSDAHAKLEAWGLKNKKESLSISFPADLDASVVERMEALGQEIKGIEGTAEDVLEDGADTIYSLNRKMETIEARSRLEAQQKAKLAEFGRRIAEHSSQIDRLTKVIAALGDTKPKELAEKSIQRDAEYLKFFKKLDEKKQLLEELYKPLNESSGAPTERGKVEFYARFKFDPRQFVANGMSIFDGRRMLTSNDRIFEERADQCWKAMQSLIPNVPAAPFAALEKEIEQHGGGSRPVPEQLAAKYTKRHFYDWIYDISYFDVEYGIKYEKVDLDKLSPGRKGVVLLMIYLDVDKDYRPLIIDQPEENLDNRSVYSTLVEYFRSAKGKRQIILVTHNANLVVNADADQVVVANFDLDRSRQTTVIEYVAGSLEFAKKKDGTDPSALTCQGIRVHVCEILEGGDEAFKRRESKYGFGTR